MFLSAFLGAFFAYLFTRIAVFFDRMHNRKKCYHNALVALETQCNKFFNVVGNNLFVINDFIEIGKNNIVKQQPFLYINELHTFAIDKKILQNLANIDLINDLFSFEETVAKTNDSISSVNKFLSIMQEALLNKSVDQRTYLANVDIVIHKMSESMVFLEDLDREDKELAAKARVLIKEHNRSLHARFISKLLHVRFTPKQLKEVKKELRALDAEMNEICNKDRERINKIVSKLGDKNERSF